MVGRLLPAYRALDPSLYHRPITNQQCIFTCTELALAPACRTPAGRQDVLTMAEVLVQYGARLLARP